MKLLFCIKAMNNPGGGAERVLADVANGLRRRGHHISVLTFEARGGKSFYHLEASIERIDLGIGSSTGRATAGATLRRIAALRSAVVTHRPDVVIAFMHSMFIPLGIALIGVKLPMIASEHTSPELYGLHPLQALLLRAVPMLVDRITCVSLQARAKYPHSLQRKMVLVPNPISTLNAERANVRGSSARRKIVVAVGRLIPLKDHETLIRAFALVTKDIADWDLRIVGAGELKDHLGAVIAETGLTSRVELVGAVDKIEVEYLNAQLYVVPSRHESFSMTTAEAIACGLPVVGFADCPGTNELIRNDINGVLVESAGDRVGALADALRDLMRSPEKRERLAAKGASSVAQFDIETVLDKWENLATECVIESTAR